MEEVWKDINLSSLHSRSDHDFSSSSAAATPISLHLHDPHSAAANFRHIILQDFLSSSSTYSKLDSSSSAAAAAVAAAAPPPTVLTLNPAGELHFPDNAAAAAHFCHPNVAAAAYHGPFDQILGPPPFGKQRIPDSDCNNSGDRRQKRMIKNRESAARSRARKQAYTNELELEVAHLMEENARLKREQEELRVAATVQVPRKHRLRRSTTAPF